MAIKIGGKVLGMKPPISSMVENGASELLRKHHPKKKARNDLPEQKNREEIVVDEYEEPEAFSHCPSSFQNTTTYSCVPGGAYLKDNESTYSGGCQVQYDGSPMYLTSAHGPAFGGDYPGDCPEDEDLTGYEIDQGGTREPFGTVHAYDYNHDFSVVDPYDNNLDNTIAPESTMIWGHVSESGIADYQSSGETIYLYGAKSGQTRTGTIKKDFQWSPCYRDSIHQEVPYIRYDGMSGCNGDSGGPFYVKDDIVGVGEFIAITSILYGGFHDYETSRGPAAYGLANNFPMDFSQDSNLC